MDHLQVITAFYQTGKTCKSIGTIKVSIARFGIDNVFQTQYSNGQYTITMRNGKVLYFSDGDYNRISAKAGFVLKNNEPIYKYALLCFVVYVRCYMDMAHVGEIIAIWQVDRGDGLGGDYAYKYLGFTANDITQLTDGDGTRDITVFTSQACYLLCNDVHVVLGTNDVYDEYGTPTPVTSFVANHNDGVGLLWGYTYKQSCCLNSIK